MEEMVAGARYRMTDKLLDELVAMGTMPYSMIIGSDLRMIHAGEIFKGYLGKGWNGAVIGKHLSEARSQRGFALRLMDDVKAAQQSHGKGLHHAVMSSVDVGETRISPRYNRFLVNLETGKDDSLILCILSKRDPMKLLEIHQARAR